MDPSSEEVSRLLARIREGDLEARSDLFEELCGELRRIAGRCMAGQPVHHTLQPTALIGEAYVRLFEARTPSFQDRQHFLATAARAMRSILVDHARAKNAQKRNPGGQREPLDEWVAAYEERSGSLLELDDALEALSRIDPRAARVVELHFFGGQGLAEVGLLLGVSERTVEREWRFARAWLKGKLG